MLEPICSPLSRLLLFFRPPPFVPSFFGQRRNLCYLLVTFIWSPRVLDLSRYSLSLSLSLQLSPFTLPRPFQLTITYQQPAASNSPELLIPDFRPVGETLSYFLFFSPPISLPPPFFFFFLFSVHFSLVYPHNLSRDPTPALPFISWQLNLSRDFGLTRGGTARAK